MSDALDPGDAPRRRSTSTSNFGVGKREGHDASAFYARFVPPTLSDDDQVNPAKATDEIWVGDSRDMDTFGDIADGSVALVVTSPPYFAGKAYEEALGQDGIPADYLEYLAMLRDVFAECVRKLEPGGRIAVNVANLGRKPYRSLSSDVIAIFEDLGLLLRGEIIWQKGKGAGGSCAWGSFQRPGNPVLRDVTERVVVASKGRFDRAVDAKARAAAGMPSTGTMAVDDFLEATLDVWELAPESARRVGHPAPFPVELPLRLIELYTYAGDLVLDPFMGAGSTAVAAVRSGRHFVGFDTDPAYVEGALARVEAERSAPPARPAVEVPPVVRLPDDAPAAAAVHVGRKATDVARRLLAEAGFTDIHDKVKVRGLALDFDYSATDGAGRPWLVAVAGGFTPSPTGLRRSDVLWRTIGQASVVKADGRPERILVLTTERPGKGTAQARSLDAVVGHAIDAVVELTADAAVAELRALHTA
ncbi:MAG TPA: site-specific DNA-methyltransferase [Acidimicrobiales bacterium]|nr:site-specific DNA-methyltransferase [Acidimicrobiales bacterium]